MNITSDKLNLNPSFQGIRFFKTTTNRNIKAAERIANMLSQDENDIIEITTNVSKSRVSFFKKIAESYIARNFNKSHVEQENSQMANYLFELIKEPTKRHSKIVSDYQGPIANLIRIFSAANNDKKKLKLIDKLNNEIIGNHKIFYENIIPELIESKHSAEYAENFSNYKSYLKLNLKNENVVKELDKMISEQTFDGEKYDKILRDKNIIENFMIKSESFNSDVYLENLTTPRENIYKELSYKFYIKESDDEEYAKQVANIFMTTNDENLSIRKALIRKYPSRNEKNTTEDIRSLNELFTTIDKDQNAREFVKEVISKTSNINNIAEFNEILRSIPSIKLNIFKQNAINIINQIYVTINKIDVLKKELTNPLYINPIVQENRKMQIKYKYRKPENKLALATKNFFKKLINNYRIRKYNKLNIPETPSLETNAQPSNKLIKIETQQVIEKAKEKEEIIVPEAVVKSKKEIMAEKKQIIKNNIFDIINKNLGAKTLEQQKGIFDLNATKIRLSLLPEMFESVKDTRKTDRLVGKQKIRSSNKDVLELYQLTNGSNKKFINYMLKKRNVDGTRMFEIKDIIEAVKKAEAKIANDKKANKNYRANDARKYYNHLYESKIQQYGKLKRIKKVDTKA